MREWILNLRMFEGGAGAAGAAAGGNAGGSAEGSQGDAGITILEDGTQVDHRLAERMEKQQKRRNRNQAAGIATGGQGNGSQAGNVGEGQGNQAEGVPQAQEQKQQTPEQEFDELIKGKYAQQYQLRMQNAISDRFKNQADLQGQLDGLKPMLDALAKQHGVKEGDYKALSDVILDDDSLYEDEAEAAGMTVNAYKSYQKLKAQTEQMAAREQKTQEEAMIRNHLQKLAQQGETLKQTFPDFNLMEELKNPKFRRLTSPEVGVSVKDAYYLIHQEELGPQIMAAGVQVARQRISQSLQANGARPVEGAAQGNTTAADVHIDPRRMTRAEREALKARVRRGETVTL